VAGTSGDHREENSADVIVVLYVVSLGALLWPYPLGSP